MKDGGQVMWRIEETGEFLCDTSFLPANQFQQNMLFSRKVEVEGRPGDSRRDDHGVDVGGSSSRVFELHDRGVEYTFARLPSLRFASVGTV